MEEASIPVCPPIRREKGVPPNLPRVEFSNPAGTVDRSQRIRKKQTKTNFLRSD
jgi:hypothetical protein